MFIRRKDKRTDPRGFSLIELVAVVAVLSILSQFAVVQTKGLINRAKVAHAVAQLAALQKEVGVFIGDTRGYPASCTAACRSHTDPFLNRLGAPGWNGPYGRLYDRMHRWKGHMTLSITDNDGDGVAECSVILDDDRPGTSGGDNGGQIPVEYLQAIDKIIDDGNLANGEARGNGLGFTSVIGELVVRCHTPA